MNSEKDILAGCIKGKPSAQRELYNRDARLLLAICNRYAKSMDEAEDILQEGFVKIFLNIKRFKGDGPLLAWMRRIMINTAITHYHKMRKHHYHDDLEEVSESKFEDKGWGEAEFTEAELFMVMQEMPGGYRQVFNLYAVEGYKHREIAVLMKIDENTSKSQYSRGRRWLQERLIKLKEERIKRDA
jgi:RNA polymerase sigma factor (sigma-70 family)